MKPFNDDQISVVSNFARLEQHDQQILINRPNYAPSGQEQYQRSYRVALNLLYRLIREEKPNFEGPIDPRDFFRVFVVEPQQLAERVRAQSGAFLVSAYHENFDSEAILARNRHIPVYDNYAITIPSYAKAHFLNDLPLMNMTTEKLFPGLDSYAAAVLNEFGLRPPPIPGRR